jgi:hypothetical protein
MTSGLASKAMRNFSLTAISFVAASFETTGRQAYFA